jgi:hypothetical protein
MRSAPVAAIALPLLLAACAGSEPPRTEADSPVVAQAASARAQPQGDLPDFHDPRLFLDLDAPGWAEWEPRPPENRAARLRELGIVPLRNPDCEFAASEQYDPCGELIADFHFVDFTGDGVDDVVYQGPWFRHDADGFASLEGTRLGLYQVIGGRAVQVMDHHGVLQRVWIGAPGEPLSFRSVHYGCCGDPYWSIEYFAPAPRGDTVRYVAYRTVLGRAEMEIPDVFLPAARRFRVLNDGYLLRDAPRVVDASGEDDWPGWPGRGNSLAEYPRDARGVALAERRDETGRVWWFVRMDGATPPREAELPEGPVHGEHRPPLDRLGWMSSRFVEVEG